MKLNELASENLRGVFRIERLNQLNRKAMRDNATYSICAEIHDSAITINT